MLVPNEKSRTGPPANPAHVVISTFKVDLNVPYSGDYTKFSTDFAPAKPNKGEFFSDFIRVIGASAEAGGGGSSPVFRAMSFAGGAR